MNILYLNPDRGIPVLGDKGASVHVREFVTALRQQGHNVVLVCATNGEGNEPPPVTLVELAPENSDADIALECIGLGLASPAQNDRVTRRELARISYDRRFAERVGRALADIGFRPDVVYERYALFHSAGASLAKSLGVTRLLEVNAPLIQEQEQFRGLSLKFVAEAEEQTSFHGADAIIAVSDEVAAYVASTGIALAKIHTIPNGVDIARFHPDAGGELVRTKHDLGNDPVVGFIGSFKPWHGVGFLIDAFAAIAQKHPDARLLCVGEGPELEPARQSIAAYGLEYRAVFTGRVPHADIPAYLAAMDVSTAPYLPHSDFYFSPLKVVESLAVGTPVVAARVGQLVKLVDDGETGFLFTPGNGDEFVVKTLDIIRDSSRRKKMAMKARAHALTNFGWDQAVARAMNEADRLLARRQCA